MSAPTGLNQLVERASPELRRKLKPTLQGPKASERERTAKTIAGKSIQRLKRNFFVPKAWLDDLVMLLKKAAEHDIALVYDQHGFDGSVPRIQVILKIEVLEACADGAKAKVRRQKENAFRDFVKGASKYWLWDSGRDVLLYSARQSTLFKGGALTMSRDFRQVAGLPVNIPSGRISPVLSRLMGRLEDKNASGTTVKAVRKFILDAVPQARTGSLDAEIVELVKSEKDLLAVRKSLFAQRQGGKPKLGIDENTPYDIKRGLADEIMASLLAVLDEIPKESLDRCRGCVVIAGMRFEVAALRAALTKGLFVLEIISALPKLFKNIEDGDAIGFINNLMLLFAGLALVLLPGFSGLIIGVSVGLVLSQTNGFRPFLDWAAEEGSSLVARSKKEIRTDIK